MLVYRSVTQYEQKKKYIYIDKLNDADHDHQVPWNIQRISWFSDISDTFRGNQTANTI